MKRSGFRFEDAQSCTGLHLYWYCQSLAQHARSRFHGHQMLPSGARILYYTRRFLLAKGVLPAVHPDEVILPAIVVERFLQAAPIIAEYLALEFSHAVRIRAAYGPQVQRIFSNGPLRSIPAFPGALEPLDERSGAVQRNGECHWETSWRAEEREHLANLWMLMLPSRLLVAPVARPEDPPEVALRLLRDLLSRYAPGDYDVSFGGSYLYDEPLETWVMRSLLPGTIDVQALPGLG